MTREEASQILKYNSNVIHQTINGETDPRELEALDMAIKALEQEDCISRQAVLSMQYRIDDSATLSTRDVVNVDDIEDLPPITPQPKTGHWIIEVWNNKEHHTCSNCQHVVTYEPCYHYCPYCGAKMVEPQESEK